MIKRKSGITTASGAGLPKGHLSPSQVEMFLRCGLQYQFRYVDGIIAPPGVALAQGKSAHFALERNNRHKLRSGEDLPTTTVLEAFQDKFSKEQKTIVNWYGLSEKKARADVCTALESYMGELAPGVRPRHIEQKIEIDIGGVPLVFVVDLVEETRPGDEVTAVELAVLDYKTTGRAKTEADVNNSIQLRTYAIGASRGCGRRVERARLVSLLKGGKASATKHVAFTKASERWVSDTYARVAGLIRTGAFHPADPGAWCCSAKWCGYWNQCRGKKR